MPDKQINGKCQIKKVVRATMLVSVGIWIGMGLSTYSKETSSAVYLVVFLLIPICACVTLWLNYRDQKQRKVPEQQQKPSQHAGQDV